MAERILNSLGILLAGLFEAEQRQRPSQPCLLQPPDASAPRASCDDAKRVDSGVHRIVG